MNTDREPLRAPAGSAKAGRWICIGLTVLVLAAAALRLRGIGFLLPQRIAVDETVLVAEMQHLRGQAGESEPLHPYGSYPDLLARIAARLPPPRARAEDPAALSTQLAEAAAPWRRMRIVVALFSVLIVPATWLFGRRFLGPGWALVAAALTAVSVLDVWFSQQARPHGPAAGLALLAVVSALRMRERPTAMSYFLAGLSLALAVGCIQSGLAVLPPILVAFFLRRRGGGEAPQAWALIVPGLLVLSLPLFYSFLFESHPSSSSRTLGLDSSSFMLTGHRLLLQDFDGTGFLAVLRALWGYEPLLSLLALLGVGFGIVQLRRRGAHFLRGHPDLLIALSFVIPYTLVIGSYHRTYQRFLLPLLPYLACSAASALRSAADWVGLRMGDSWGRRVAATSLVLLPLGAEALAAWKLVSIRASPDTLSRAADWITGHLRPGEDRIFVLPEVDLPIFQSSRALVANEAAIARILPWSWHQLQVPPEQRPSGGYDLFTMPMSTKAQRGSVASAPEDYLRGLRGDYAVMEVYEDFGWRALPGLRVALQRVADRVARFSPYLEDMGDDLALDYQDFPGRLGRAVAWTWRVLHAGCTGPVIEIYRFRD